MKRGIIGMAVLTAAFLYTLSSQAADPIKIGILESRSGNFALHSAPKYMAAQLAVKEINDKGGVIGRQLELVAPDPQSDNRRFQELARMLIQRDKVDVLFGGFASAEREAIRPIIDQYKMLYFYNNQYEGGVADKYTFCTGPVPEQQIDPVIKYCIEKFGPRMYILAADYNFGQLSAKWTHVMAEKYGGEVVGEEFIPLATSQFASTLERVQSVKPDFLVMYITGDNHASFYPQAQAAGLKIPYASSINVAQGYEHRRFPAPTLSGMHIGIHYVEELNTEPNGDFVKRFKAMFPDVAYIGEQTENTYVGVYLYAMAVEKAGTTDIPKVIDALESGLHFDAPEGPVILDPATHHLIRDIRIVVVDDDHQLHFPATYEQLKPDWLSSEKGVDLTKKPEFVQYEP
ncbi:MAG: urea ABC transporter substrate-binding protein [Planctomycetaceae bacterium]|nr:urea ABC transporter substrate-binding protein [Planctomycetaceae bacterium]